MYRRVLKATPGDSSTLNRVGDLLARVDKYSEAIQLYRETAELFVEQGFYVKAIAVYKKIHRLDPGQLDIYRKLAELYTLQGLHNDARTHYEVLVDYHDRQGDLPAAIGVCRKLAELQPLDPAHRTRLAELYERKGDTASVAREYFEIARLLLSRGAFEKATQVLERALAVNSGDAELLIDSVRLLRAEGHHDFAESFLNDAEEMNVQAGRHRLVADVRERLLPEEPPVVPAGTGAGRGGRRRQVRRALARSRRRHLCAAGRRRGGPGRAARSPRRRKTRWPRSMSSSSTASARRRSIGWATCCASSRRTCARTSA